MNTVTNTTEIQMKHEEKSIMEMREVALTAVFTTLVFLSTSLFSIALVSSTGYFNLGECFIFLAALVGGPIVAAIAGGVGASMADLALGYGSFAPATLVLKGAEGYSAGYLLKKSKEVDQNIRLAVIAVVSLFIVIFSIVVSFHTIEGGFALHYINLSGNPAMTSEILFEIPPYVFLAIAFALVGGIWFVALRFGENGQMALACVLSGLIIVVGYFLYEIIFLDIPVPGAASEIVFNIGQVVFGAAIAISLYSYLHQLGVISDEDVAFEKNKTP